MNTTPPPVKPYDHPDPHMWVWTPNEIRWIEARDAQWMERITTALEHIQKAREANALGLDAEHDLAAARAALESAK